ncbi:Ankyrin repeats containing protein [Cardinium endosymbiont of Sogatella furcifera]|uniref:ankyrin repeat domain-containing protein n=1 Tax=Cardinium endosymbiont of Sogatella furcifera TaxID=650378 RepID=UPI000E0D9EF3|nr:ankyrin repeat domain-containing protein [Cardinium endosymbiont of Sogatella furcifera]AXI24568.1 Ankyrin repeats containing protein [Cardinium endosymbiont of Sogatella furcifera]
MRDLKSWHQKEKRKALCSFADQGNDGFTPLHLAVERGIDSAMAALLGFTNLGIDVNAQSKDHRTPLHIASYNGNVKMVQELLKIGDINVNLQECRGWTPAHLAVYQSHIEVVQALLQSGKIDLYKKNANGHTVIDLAKIQNNRELLKMIYNFT